MLLENKLIELIDGFNKAGRTATFAEFLASAFKDKFIEIYLGDSYEEVNFEQTSMNYPAVLCGKVVAAYKECLIINSVYTEEGSNDIKLGNLIFISERAIRALNEVDGHGVLEDMLFRSRESTYIKSIIVDGKPQKNKIKR